MNAREVFRQQARHSILLHAKLLGSPVTENEWEQARVNNQEELLEANEHGAEYQRVRREKRQPLKEDGDGKYQTTETARIKNEKLEEEKRLKDTGGVGGEGGGGGGGDGGGGEGGGGGGGGGSLAEEEGAVAAVAERDVDGTLPLSPIGETAPAASATTAEVAGQHQEGESNEGETDVEGAQEEEKEEEEEEEEED